MQLIYYAVVIYVGHAYSCPMVHRWYWMHGFRFKCKFPSWKRGCFHNVFHIESTAAIYLYAHCNFAVLSYIYELHQNSSIITAFMWPLVTQIYNSFGLMVGLQTTTRLLNMAREAISSVPRRRFANKQKITN